MLCPFLQCLASKNHVRWYVFLTMTCMCRSIYWAAYDNYAIEILSCKKTSVATYIWNICIIRWVRWRRPPWEKWNLFSGYYLPETVMPLGMKLKQQRRLLNIKSFLTTLWSSTAFKDAEKGFIRNGVSLWGYILCRAAQNIRQTISSSSFACSYRLPFPLDSRIVRTNCQASTTPPPPSTVPPSTLPYKSFALSRPDHNFWQNKLTFEFSCSAHSCR